MSRKQPKRRAGKMAHVAIAGFFILAIAGGVGFGVASADSSDDLARAGAFGFDEATHEATLSLPAHDADSSEASESPLLDQSALASASIRDISAGLRMVDEREAAEKARIEAENAAAIKRMEAEKSMQGVSSPKKPDVMDSEDSAIEEDLDAEVEQLDRRLDEQPDEQLSERVAEQPEEQPVEQAMEYNLPAVDWSVGKEAFLEEWTARIDAYLAGSTLQGYGSVFAEAAWDNGVDPRWSPAISNTESTKGAHCFLPCNAWGWGASSWPDWTTAIREHVAGLAETYGYSLTPTAAQVYCPPNHVNWYNNTLNQMAQI